jgi:hypothetical protein
LYKELPEIAKGTDGKMAEASGVKISRRFPTSDDAAAADGSAEDQAKTASREHE